MRKNRPQVSERRASAMTMPPAAPMPAASTGVKNPPYRPPITRANSSNMPQIPRSAMMRWRQGVRSPGGPRWGQMVVVTMIATMYIRAPNRPGRMPAANSLPMSDWVMMP